MKSHVGMLNCFYCNEPMGVLFDRRLRNKLPMNCGIMDMEPCHKCKEFMKRGIILISIKDSTTDEDMAGRIPNPHRTGCWAVVKEEVIKNVGPKSLIDFGLKHRLMFITDSAWDKLGLPKEEVRYEV